MTQTHSIARLAAPVGALLTCASIILAACGGGSGGGGGSPTTQTPDDPGTSQPPMVTEPLPPATPVVDGSVTVANAAAIDPTLSFRAVRAPAADGFTVTKTVPDSPVTVFTRHDHPDSPTPPADLDAMAARAALLWTRRLTGLSGSMATNPYYWPPKLTENGTYHVDILVGDPRPDNCSGHAACAAIPGPYANNRFLDHPRIKLPARFLTEGANAQGNLKFSHFKTIVHEVGHTLHYIDPDTGTGHPDCGTHTEQIMCPSQFAESPSTPTEADFDGIRHAWTVGPDTDYQDFGLWASVSGSSDLKGFGVTLRRTVNVNNPARSISDTMVLAANIEGSPSTGPSTGIGTATWSGIFLGANTDRFEPVTGDATLTGDLENLASIDLALSNLGRTDSSGVVHPLANIPYEYELQRHGNAWVDADGRADASFYQTDTDPAGAAGGIVNDGNRDLVGAWGATRNK